MRPRLSLRVAALLDTVVEVKGIALKPLIYLALIAIASFGCGIDRDTAPDPAYYNDAGSSLDAGIDGGSDTTFDSGTVAQKSVEEDLDPEVP